MDIRVGENMTIMTDSNHKTRKELLGELTALRRRFAELQAQESAHLQVKEALHHEKSKLEDQVAEQSAELVATQTALHHQAVERQRAEEIIRLQSEIFEHMAESVCLVRLHDQAIIFANARLEQMFGYEAGELIGAPIMRLSALSDQVSDVAIGDVLQCVRDQGNWRGEIYTRRKDGSPFWCYCNISTFNHAHYGPVWVAVIEDITQRRQAERLLRESRAELRELTARLFTIQEEERRRISRDLHDHINQQIAALAIDLSTIQRRLPLSAEDVIGPLQVFQTRLATLSDEIRRLSHQLHPSSLDDLGLPVALQSWIHDFSRREGIKVKFQKRGIPSFLPKPVASSLYYVAQEALRNVAKHAKTDRATVTFSRSAKDLRMVITDHGVGFDLDVARSQRPGLGLVSMYERIRMVHGTLTLQSHSDRGTHVQIVVPLSRAKS